MSKKSFGDTSYNALQEIFQMDSEDMKGSGSEYKIEVELMKDSASVDLNENTMKFQT